MKKLLLILSVFVYGQTLVGIDGGGAGPEVVQTSVMDAARTLAASTGNLALNGLYTVGGYMASGASYGAGVVAGATKATGKYLFNSATGMAVVTADAISNKYAEVRPVVGKAVYDLAGKARINCSLADVHDYISERPYLAIGCLVSLALTKGAYTQWRSDRADTCMLILESLDIDLEHLTNPAVARSDQNATVERACQSLRFPLSWGVLGKPWGIPDRELHRLVVDFYQIYNQKVLGARDGHMFNHPQLARNEVSSTVREGSNNVNVTVNSSPPPVVIPQNQRDIQHYISKWSGKLPNDLYTAHVNLVKHILRG